MLYIIFHFLQTIKPCKWYGYEVSGMTLLHDLIIVKTCQCIFQLVPIMISMH